MAKTTPLHEVVKLAEGVGHVELIDVPVPGDAVVLLRVKSMPEFAFVMWVAHTTGTFSQMAFRMPYNGYSVHSVVCACCRSEFYGLEAPKDADGEDATGEQIELWEKAQAAKFKAAVENAAKANGIHTFFMRKADRWPKHYGESPGLSFIEADDFQSAMCELYGRKPVRDAWRFIDQEHSRGVGTDRR